MSAVVGKALKEDLRDFGKSKPQSAKYGKAVKALVRATTFGGMSQLQHQVLSQAFAPSEAVRSSCKRVSDAMVMPKIVAGLECAEHSMDCITLIANMTHWDVDCDAFIAARGLHTLLDRAEVLDGPEADARAILLSNMCRSQSRGVLGALTELRGAIIKSVSLGVAQNSIVGLCYALEVLDFYCNYEAGLAAIRGNPVLRNALGYSFMLCTEGYSDASEQDRVVLFGRLQEFIHSRVFDGKIKDYEFWKPFSEVVIVPMLLLAHGNLPDPVPEQSMLILSLLSVPQRSSERTRTKLWKEASQLCIQCAGDPDASLERRASALTIPLNMFASNQASVIDEVEPVKDTLVPAVLSVLQEPLSSTNPSAGEVWLKAAEICLHLARSGIKGCRWLIRFNGLKALLTFIWHRQSEQSLSNEQPVSRAVTALQLLTICVVGDSSGDSAASLLRREELDVLRASDMDSIIGKMITEPSSAHLDEAGKSSLTSALQKIKLLQQSIFNNVVGFCAVCGSSESLTYCSGCKSVQYCCARHQKEHWKCHKQECASLKEKRAKACSDADVRQQALDIFNASAAPPTIVCAMHGPGCTCGLEPSFKPQSEPSSLPSVPMPEQGVVWELATGQAPLDLFAGRVVRLDGLSSSPALNGIVGVLGTFHADKGRWEVSILDGTVKLLRPENILVSAAHGAQYTAEDTQWLAGVWA